MQAPSSAVNERRSNLERRATMQQRLLRAAVDVLREHGYAGTTTQAVQDAAGVSRGALLHHYASKQELLVAAVAHLASEHSVMLTARARTRPRSRADGGIGAWLDDLWESFDSPLFAAVLELWIAARTDEALRAALLPYERDVKARIVQLSHDVLAPEVLSAQGFAEALDLTLLQLRGLALTRVVTGPTRPPSKALRVWREHLVERLLPRG